MRPLDRAQAVAYGELINAAYATYLADPDSLTPKPKDIPSGFAMVAWIYMSDFAFDTKVKKFYGFVVQNLDVPGTHVVVIRGAEGLVEWYDEATAVKTLFAPVPGAGSVAAGFDAIYATLEVVPYTPPPLHDDDELPIDATPLSGSFAEQIAALVATSGPPRVGGLAPAAPPSVAVTGHSLGAALCTLYVMENAAKKMLNISLICTFASPRVGDATFVAAFNNLPGLTSWRIKNTRDIVPKLPPALLGYGDVDELYEFSSDTVRFSPACWHSMRTYLNWLDPKQPLDPDCDPSNG